MSFLYSICFPAIDEFCSGELLGSKFVVPCKVSKILSIHYGNENQWMNPTKNNYPITNVDWKNAEYRSVSEMPYMFRYFYSNGTINVDKTLKSINNYYTNVTGKTLKSLPKDDDEFI